MSRVHPLRKKMRMENNGKRPPSERHQQHRPPVAFFFRMTREVDLPPQDKQKRLMEAGFGRARG